MVAHRPVQLFQSLVLCALGSFLLVSSVAAQSKSGINGKVTDATGGELPGVTVYGVSPEEATLKAKALALRVIAEEIEHGEMPPGADTLQFSVAA